MLLRDLTSGKIVDPTGVSLSDLREGILQGHPQVDIHRTFEADPLRVLRVLRFKLKYDWKIHPEVIEGVINCCELIQRVSWERIRDELISIAEYGRLGSAIEWMDQVGLLEFIFPEVISMKGVEQDTLHHSEGDVFVHTLLLLQKANPGVIPQFSALLHDVGKHQTQTVHLPKKEGEVRRIKFLDHENVGAKMSEEILRRLKFENSVIEKISKIVRFHLRAHFSKDWSAKAVRKFARDCGEELEDILHISEIDSLSSYGPAGLPKENLIPALRKQLGKAIQIPIRKKTVLTGEEVMGLLNLSPGKSVGEALLLLQDIEDEYAVRGEPLNPEDAMRLLKARYFERRMK
jgi:putative nucleotidyltransferase with HDIG domain